MKESYSYNALKVLKNLTDQEARGLLMIIKKGVKMSKAEIAKEFSNSKISTKTNAYEIIRSLHNKEMLNEIETGFFEPIFPKTLIKECGENLEKMKEEINNIVITLDLEKEEKKEKAKIILKEHEIMHQLRRLIKKYSIKFLKKKRSENPSFWDYVGEEFGEKSIKEGNLDCIIFEDTKKDLIKGGIILLSEKLISTDGRKEFNGTLIFDPELKNYFNKEYEKK